MFPRISTKRPSTSSASVQLGKRLSKWVSVALLCGASNAVWAQDAFDPDDAQSVKLGETDLYPSVRIDYLQSSNAFLTPDDPITASDVTISPELNWVADRRLVNLLGTYSGNYNASSEEALNYADHSLSLKADAELSSRKRVGGRISLNFGHEDLGINLTRGDASENSDFVQFTNIEASTRFRYGADQAKGNATAGLKLQSFGYNSRSDVTAGRDFTLFEPFAAFSYRLSGDTRAVTEIRFATVGFDNSDQDRTDLTLLAGMDFAATGKTGGNFRIGAVQSQPSSSGTPATTDLVAEASLFWEPTSYSRFNLRGTRLLDNEQSFLVDGDTEVSVSDRVELDWQHEWSSRVSHSAYLQNYLVNRDCPGRRNNTVSGRLELNFQVRRWISVGINGRGTSGVYSDCPEQTIENLDFEQTRFGAHIRATL